MLFQRLLADSARRVPQREAVVYKKRRVTYGEIEQNATRLGFYLTRHRNLLPGERVVLLLDNSPEYVVSYFGVLAAGGIVVPLNPETTAHELKDILRDCAPKGVICQASSMSAFRELQEELRQLDFVVMHGPRSSSDFEEECGKFHDFQESLAAWDETWKPYCPAAEDVAQIIYTSGTTGRPKGVMLTNGNLLANTESIVSYLHLTERDRVELILPFYYSYGNSILLTHVRVGGSLVLADQFVFLQAIVNQMLSEHVTGFSGVPSSFAMLERNSSFFRTSFETLRYVTCAGGALPKAMIVRLQAALPRADIVIMYGQTEASARLSYLPPRDLPRKIGSIGKGIPGVNLRVVLEDGSSVQPGEVGEIVAEGSCIMKGYWHNEGETQKVLQAGQLHTGDLATVDDEGYIFIVGRQSDTIKYGSYRIHPSQIEEVLSICPDVEQVAVAGQPSETLGEIIVAWVVRRPGSPMSSSDLLQFAKQFLPTYKLPQRVIFVDDLPKTASGKVKRRQLRDMMGKTR